MKFSTFSLLFVFCLLAFAQADTVKPKPKPKPKKHSHYQTQAPSMMNTMFVTSNTPCDTDALESSDIVKSATTTTLESTGIVAVLGGVAVACVVAIVAIVRKPVVEHEVLPDSSEQAVDRML